MPDCDNSAEIETVLNDMPVLGLAGCHWRKIDSRYVDPASQIDITECHSRLRWLQNYDIPCSPLQITSRYDLNTTAMNIIPHQKQEVLHLCRCSTHTCSVARTFGAEMSIGSSVYFVKSFWVEYSLYVCVYHLNRCKTSNFAGGHRGPGGVGDQRRHLPGTRANVPAGRRWCTWAQL